MLVAIESAAFICATRLRRHLCQRRQNSSALGALCHRRGFILSQSPSRSTLPTPLHSSWCEWVLHPTRACVCVCVCARVWVSVWVDVVHVACFLATTCTVTSRTSASPSSSACGIFARGFVLGFDTRRKLHAGRSGSRNALYILVIKWHVLSERNSHTMLGSGVTTPRVAKKTLRDVCWLSRLVTTKI